MKLPLGTDAEFCGRDTAGALGLGLLPAPLPITVTEPPHTSLPGLQAGRLRSGAEWWGRLGASSQRAHVGDRKRSTHMASVNLSHLHKGPVPT